jgi:isochorismate pyruvate lyase
MASTGSFSSEPNIEREALREFTDGTEPLCSSLGEIRENIDAIDRSIVMLLGERIAYVKDAARFKEDDIQVAAQARQEEVLNRVREIAVAEHTGIEAFPEQVVDVFSVIVSSSVAVQQTEFLTTKPIQD